MHCPFCGHPHSRVTDSRVVENGIRRRRECQSQACELRFTTYERVQAAPLMVSKQDNRREEFNREKLISGIRKACAKRPVASRTIDKLVEDIEAELQHRGNMEVSTTVIGTMVMDRLRDLDRVAYIRYASVYRDFQDIESFERAVRDLREDGPQLPLPEGKRDQTPPRRTRLNSTTGQHRPRTPGTNRRSGRPRSTGT